MATDFILKVLFVSGIANIIFLLLVLASCRCIDFWRITSKLLNYKKYQIFYRFHCYYWYGFIISVLIHSISALYLFGWPFR